MGGVLALVGTVVTILPDLIKLGADVSDLWANTQNVIQQNRVPGDAEWDALDAKVNALKAQLMVDPPAVQS